MLAGGRVEAIIVRTRAIDEVGGIVVAKVMYVEVLAEMLLSVGDVLGATVEVVESSSAVSSIGKLRVTGKVTGKGTGTSHERWRWRERRRVR